MTMKQKRKRKLLMAIGYPRDAARDMSRGITFFLPGDLTTKQFGVRIHLNNLADRMSADA
jgi:hypothetical protein